MPDILNSQERSDRMRLVRSKDTKPEMGVRRMVYKMGFRYRLHRKDLPGKPDLTFIAKRKVIFVHGCFWHRHDDPGCRFARLPKSRLDYWKPKLDRNRKRDREHQKKLADMGWKVLVVWEYELKDMDALAGRVRDFLIAP